MISLLYPCLLLLLSFLPHIAAQTNATQPQITYLYIGGDQGWTQGFEYPPYEVNPGMQLVFEWNGQHNVVMLRDKNAYDTCNMAQSTVLATTSQGRGNTQFANIYVYNVTRTPVFFSCSLPNHCTNGMKFAAITPGTLGQFNVSQVGTDPSNTPTAPGPGTPTLPGTPTAPGGVGVPTIPGGVGGPTIPGVGPSNPTGTGVGPTTAAPTDTVGPTTATTTVPTTVVPTFTPTATTAPTETPTMLPTDAATMPPIMTTVTPTPTATGPTIAVMQPTPSMNATDAPTPPPNHAVRDDVRMVSIVLMIAIAALGMTIA